MTQAIRVVKNPMMHNNGDEYLTDIIGISFLVSGFIEIALPLVFAFILIKRLHTGWKTWFIGAMMFLLSLIRIPLNTFLTNIAVSGTINYITYLLVYLIPSLTAGIFEESARYIGLKYLIKDESYENGLTYGAGHGGIESIFLVGINVFTLGIILLTSPESLPQMQLYSIQSTPWYLPLVGAYERIMAMIIQISLSIMVLEALRTKQIKYLGIAILAHTAVNYLSASAVSYSVLYAELVVTGFAIGLGQWAYTKVKDSLKV